MPAFMAILALTAFVTTIVAAAGKCPAWMPCVPLSVIAMIQAWPK